MKTNLDSLIANLNRQRVSGASSVAVALDLLAPLALLALAGVLSASGMTALADKIKNWSPGRANELSEEERYAINWAMPLAQQQINDTTISAYDLGLSFAEGDNGPASMPVPKIPDITKEEALAELEAALADAIAHGDVASADGLERAIIVIRANGVGPELAREVSHLNRDTGAGIPDTFLQYAQEFIGAIASEAQETAAGITMAAENIESILSYGKLPDPKDRCIALRTNMREMLAGLNMSKIAFKVSWFSAKSEAILVRAAKYVDDWCSGMYGPGPMTN